MCLKLGHNSLWGSVVHVVLGACSKFHFRLSVFNDNWVTHYWVKFLTLSLIHHWPHLMPSLPFPRSRPCCDHLRYLVVRLHLCKVFAHCQLLAAFVYSFIFLFLHIYTSTAYFYFLSSWDIMRSAPWGFKVAQFRACIVSRDQSCSNHGVKRCSREPFDQLR